jgi:4-hydroxy-tetrahydrodipicolinate reductase
MSAVEAAPPLRIAVAGASGRMGQMLIGAVLAATDLRLTGALDTPTSTLLGQDAGTPLGRSTGVTVTANLDQGLSAADVLIDFTRPEGTMAHMAACQRHGVKMVIGTTGFDAAQKAAIAEHAQQLPVVMAPNMMVGVNVVLKLLEMAAKALGNSYDIEVIEAHHRHKVDSPSGTALKMGEVVAQSLGRDLKTCGVFGRDGHTGERERSAIGFSAIRGGDIIGDHTVLFAGTGERIEITHKASSRAGYAEGSLRAARFLAGQRSGLFGMEAVLGL